MGDAQRPAGHAPYLLGIDSGLTVTKAVVYDRRGVEMGSGSVRIPQEKPHPRWVERDMNGVWESVQYAIREALKQAGVTGSQISGVAATGHGDGVYLLDDHYQPIRPGILSLDTRAYQIIEQWGEQSILERGLQLTGQYPYAAAPAAVLAWLRDHEPENYAKIRWFLPCKDWIKFKLTGEIATDPTEGSLSFTDVRTQTYSSAAFALYGLEEMELKAPPIIESSQIAGRITPEAAEATGLAAGTPVVASLHDVDACAIGIGCTRPGQLSMMAGTFSINQVISDQPMIDPRWACRNFVRHGQWMNMSISPASAANLDWFVQEFCQLDLEQAREQNRHPFAFVNEEIAAVLDEPSSVIFLPFLYGSPYGNIPSATFFGLRGWHNRGHIMRAIYEGVAFNHRTHIDALRSAFEAHEVRVTGGGSRSEIWAQTFADSFGLPVITTEARESGALGAVICAGIGAGVYASLEDAVEQTVRTVRVYEPQPARQAMLNETYQVFTQIADALKPVWADVEQRANRG